MGTEVDKAEGVAEAPRPTESVEAAPSGPARAATEEPVAQRSAPDEAEGPGKASEGEPRSGFRSLEQIMKEFQKSRVDTIPKAPDGSVEPSDSGRKDILLAQEPVALQAEPSVRAPKETKSKAGAEGKAAKASDQGKAAAEIRAETKAEVRAAKAALVEPVVAAEKAAAKATAAGNAETKAAKVEVKGDGKGDGKKKKESKENQEKESQENKEKEGNKEGKMTKAEKKRAKEKLALKPLDSLVQDFGKKRVENPAPTKAERSHETKEHTNRPAKDGSDRSKKSRVGTLKKLVGGKGFGFVVPDDGSADVFLHFSDLMGSQDQRDRDMSLGMRVRYDPEVDPQTGKTRARNASIIEGSAAESAQQHPEKEKRRKGDKEPPAEPRAYDKEELLRAFELVSKRGRGKRERDGVSGLTTVYMPRTKEPSDRRARLLEYAEENPDLDDEHLLVKHEARLSRESGADANNSETFGDCGGWSFEEAVAANDRINGELQAHQRSSGSTSTVRIETIEEEQQHFQVHITLEDMRDRDMFEHKLSLAAAAVGISKDDIDTEYLTITDAHGRTFGLEHQPPGPPSNDMFPCVVAYEPPQAQRPRSGSMCRAGTSADRGAPGAPKREEDRHPQESERCVSTAAPSAASAQCASMSGSSAASPAISRATTPVDNESGGEGERATRRATLPTRQQVEAEVAAAAAAEEEEDEDKEEKGEEDEAEGASAAEDKRPVKESFAVTAYQ